MKRLKSVRLLCRGTSTAAGMDFSCVCFAVAYFWLYCSKQTHFREAQIWKDTKCVWRKRKIPIDHAPYFAWVKDQGVKMKDSFFGLSDEIVACPKCYSRNVVFIGRVNLFMEISPSGRLLNTGSKSNSDYVRSDHILATSVRHAVMRKDVEQLIVKCRDCGYKCDAIDRATWRAVRNGKR